MNKADAQILSLSDLQSGIKDAIHLRFPDYLWVHAELSEVNIQRNGHCYVELVEKEADQVMAKVRGTIWNFTFRMLKPYFESSTGYEFKSGIKVSLKISIEFHEVYGLSLNIKDIDPSYTVGDIELQKRKIIQQLENDGIMDMNAELEIPMVPQNIAVISSPTAAGFGDWETQIKNNPYHYQFKYQLFEAQMQGQNTGSSIIGALERIYQDEQEFDLVVIIRGGGSKMDLAGFDHYELAANIAQFPMPIITGIGHERDESIADLVAHTALKTPTAVADFLIDALNHFENHVDRISNSIIQHSKEILDQSSHELEMAVQNLQQISKYKLKSSQDFLLQSTKFLLRNTQSTNSFAQEKLNHFSEKIQYESKRILKRKKEVLDQQQDQLKNYPFKILQRQNRLIYQLDKLNNAFDPKLTLERGFAIIEQDNKIITTSKAIQKDQKLKIIMKDGELER